MWVVMNQDLLAPALTDIKTWTAPEALAACRDIAHAAEHLATLGKLLAVQSKHFHVIGTGKTNVVKLSLLHVRPEHVCSDLEMVQALATIFGHISEKLSAPKTEHSIHPEVTEFATMWASSRLDSSEQLQNGAMAVLKSLRKKLDIALGLFEVNPPDSWGCSYWVDPDDLHSDSNSLQRLSFPKFKQVDSFDNRGSRSWTSQTLARISGLTQLGSGNFSTVHLGWLEHDAISTQYVAVKKPRVLSPNEILEEIMIINSVGHHRNVMKVCTWLEIVSSRCVCGCRHLDCSGLAIRTCLLRRSF